MVFEWEERGRRRDDDDNVDDTNSLAASKEFDN